MSDIVREIDKYAPKAAYEVTIGHADEGRAHLTIIKPWDWLYKSWANLYRVAWLEYGPNMLGYDGNKQEEIGAVENNWGWLNNEVYDDSSERLKAHIDGLLAEDSERALLRGADYGRDEFRPDLEALLIGTDDERTVARLFSHLSTQAAATDEPASSEALQEAAEYIVAQEAE